MSGNEIEVILDIQDSERPGYTRVESYQSYPPGKSGAPLWYRYTGGNTTADDGTIDLTVGEGPATIRVTTAPTALGGLVTSAFSTVDPDAAEEAAAKGVQGGSPRGGHSAVFTDPDLQAGSGGFGVGFTRSVVTDGVVEWFRYRCDPRWVNRPT